MRSDAAAAAPGRTATPAAVLPGAHLTVSAVAARLGVAASTLRTWDRRYGLGPSEHVAGSHRRYSPDDLARLETMRALTQRGVAPVDAARIAVRSAPVAGEAPDEDTADGVDPLSLAAAAVETDETRLRRLLHGAVARDGLVAAYTDLVRPALAIVAAAGRSELPGHAAQTVLAAGMLAVVRERQASRGTRSGPGPAAPVVLVVAPDELWLAAHVLAQAIAEAGVRTRVGRCDPRAAGGLGAGTVVVLAGPFGDEADGVASPGPGAAAAFLGALAAGRDAPLVVVGHDVTGVPSGRDVHRVRTIAGAVPEVVDVARRAGRRGGPW